jgi:hypothetical protein
MPVVRTARYPGTCGAPDCRHSQIRLGTRCTRRAILAPGRYAGIEVHSWSAGLPHALAVGAGGHPGGGLCHTTRP